MDEIPFELDERARDIQARARAFTEDVLIPLEEEAERRHGRLPDDVVDDVKRAAVDAGLVGGLHRPEHGGQGWSRLQWALVEEQCGPLAPTRSTGTSRTPTTSGSTPSAERRSSAGSCRPCAARSATPTRSPSATPAPTRAGSRTRRRADRRRLPDQRREVVRDHRRRRLRLHRHGQRDRRRRRSCRPCSSSIANAAGIEIVDDPAFTHSYPDGHPTIVFRDVEVDRARRDRRRSAAATTCSAPGSWRSGSGSPPAASARCGGCSTRPSPGRRAASRAATGSSTTRASPSRSPTRPPTPPPGGC